MDTVLLYLVTLLERMPMASNGAVALPVRSIAIDALYSKVPSTVGSRQSFIQTCTIWSDRIGIMSTRMIFGRLRANKSIVVHLSIRRAIRTRYYSCSWEVFSDLDFDIALITLSSLPLAFLLVRIV